MKSWLGLRQLLSTGQICYSAKGLYPPPRGESEIMGLEMAGIVEEIGETGQ